MVLDTLAVVKRWWRRRTHPSVEAAEAAEEVEAVLDMLWKQTWC